MRQIDLINKKFDEWLLLMEDENNYDIEGTDKKFEEIGKLFNTSEYKKTTKIGEDCEIRAKIYHKLKEKDLLFMMQETSHKVSYTQK